jgi:hypothetical protein
MSLAEHWFGARRALLFLYTSMGRTSLLLFGTIAVMSFAYLAG